MNNYEFCADWVLDSYKEKCIKVLDYGCGAGEIVNEIRKLGIEAFGCDIFYEGGDYSKFVDKTHIGSVIKKMNVDGDQFTIPFRDCLFDVVISNQVLEHVQNLERALDDINRVLKPGGTVLFLFPSKDVWREGHTGVPFLHWFKKNSIFRIYYAAVFHYFGFGYHRDNIDAISWSRGKCEWLDKWTYYRQYDEIKLSFATYFTKIDHIEDYWLRKRLGRYYFVVFYLPSSVQKFLVRKLCGLIILARKV
jgi:SAM-dependent methyltransferase